MKDEKENIPLVDMVAVVAEVCGAVCQLHSRLWNTTLASQSLYQYRYALQEDVILTSGGKGLSLIHI